jgi:phosphotransferase system enzyme I (PtsI)
LSATASFHGIGASPGIAIGNAFVIDARRVRTPKVKLKTSEVDSEVMRFQAPRSTLSNTQLEDVKTAVDGTGEGGEHALILEAHRMMLHDPMFIVEVSRLIKDDTINAEWAVRRVCRRLRHQFDDLDDEYFRERRSDIEFVADRVVRNLMGEVVDQDLEVPVGAIVVAHDISPADAAMLVKTTRSARSSPTSAVTPATPPSSRARVRCPRCWGLAGPLRRFATETWWPSTAAAGWCCVNPTDEQLALFRETMRRQLASEEQALKSAELPAVTTDGVRVRLNGNIEFPEEIPSLLAHGAEGIGLYRTEFLFLEPKHARPTKKSTTSRIARCSSDGRPAGDDSHPRPGRRQGARARSPKKRTTRRWACAPFATACSTATCSGCSCGRCCARRCTATCG